MRLIVGDLWEQPGWIVIPTNLAINPGGLAVMGLGVAKQAVLKFPQLPVAYGAWLQENAEEIRYSGQNSLVTYPDQALILFPVKFTWPEKASLDLIEDGCRCLQALDPDRFSRVFLPLLGCGYGEVPQEEIFPILTKLDDRFTLVLRDAATTLRYRATLRPGIRRDTSRIYSTKEE